MKDNEIIALVNELLSYAEIYEGMLDLNLPNPNAAHFSHYVENENKHYSFRIDLKYIDEYKKLLNGIYSKKSIKERYTMESIDKALHTFLFDNKFANKNVSETIYQRFIQSLINKEHKKITFFHMVYGLDVTHTEPVNVGCFTFYNYKNHKKQIINQAGYTKENDFINVCGEFAEHNIWVSTDIEACNAEYAREIAYRRFEALEGICQLVLELEKLNGHIVCVLEDIPQSRGVCHSFCDGSVGSKFDNYFYRVKNIDLINLLTDNHKLFITLIERLFTTERNDINNRIINALTSYGRVSHQHSSTQKFLLYVTTIEALVEYNTTDLTELISRYTSCLLSEKDYYKEIKEDLKIVYNQRSEISHGSRIDIQKGDLEYAHIYSGNLLLRFITDESIKTLKKNKDLKAYLETKAKTMEEGAI